METFNNDNIKYLEAKKKVKRIKGFYTHAAIFVLVNSIIAFINYQALKPGQSYFVWYNFLSLFFWGIGLFAHGMGVFMPSFIFGKDWEEKKIRELMNKYK